MSGTPGPEGSGDRILGWVLIGATVLVAAVLATGHLSTLVVNQGLPRFPLAEVPGVLWRVAVGLDDPGRAWDPVNTGTPVPGPVGWWGTFAGLFVVPIAVAAALLARGRRRDEPPETTWASGRALKRLRVDEPDGDRLVIGRCGHSLVATEQRHSVLVFGPSQSGKTTGFAIPAILEWAGPVIATSVKDDLLRDTIGHRSRLGPTHVFDPAGVSEFTPARWSPLVGCDTWAGAMARAHELAGAGKAAVGGEQLALGDFWFTSAAKALAPYLLAAATHGHTMTDVARWIDAEDHDGVTELLWHHPDALLALDAAFKREERARSSIFQVLQTIVGVYLDPAVARSASRSDFDPTTLLEGTSTLYLTAPARDQDRFRPLFAALMGQIIDAAFSAAARNGGRPLDPPLLIVLDEAANIAPVANLDQIASTAAAMGVQIVTVFQDLAQVRARYGERSATILNNHRGTLFLPGLKCPDTLDYLSRLVGERDFDRPSHSVDHQGHHSHSASAQRYRLLPSDVARTLEDGEAVLLYGNVAPVRLKLRPWYRDRRLRSRAELVRQSGTTPTAAGAPRVQ